MNVHSTFSRKIGEATFEASGGTIDIQVFQFKPSAKLTFWLENQVFEFCDGAFEAHLTFLRKPAPKPPRSHAKPKTHHPLLRFRESREPPLSQEALAQMLGVTKATISRWESGERFPDREFWPRIKETTGIGIEELAAPSTEKGAAA